MEVRWFLSRWSGHAPCKSYIRGNMNQEWVCWPSIKKRSVAHQAIDDLQVAVTGRVFGNSSDLSSSRGRVRERNGPRLTHQRSDTVSIFTIDGHRAPAGFQQNLDRLRRVHPRGEPQRSNPVHRLLRGVQRVQRYVAVFHEHPEDVQPVRRHK